MLKSKSGFTIVELLIVIVVIAILAAITIVAYNGISVRAQAAGIVSDLKATEKALKAYKVSSGAESWWIDSDSALTGSGNPTIANIISAQPTFKDFLQKAPTTTGLGTPNSWIYDSENDTYNGCSASLAGVNIALINTTNSALVQAIDNQIDDGNLACGKFRVSSAYILYSISNSP